jgi:hypothetical protein
MSNFKFGQLTAEVERLKPLPSFPGQDLHRVIIKSPEWVVIEASFVTKVREARTVAYDFDMAYGMLGSLHEAAIRPAEWKKVLETKTDMSPEQIKHTLEIAQEMKPYLPAATISAIAQYPTFNEYRQGNVGPLEPGMGIARRLAMPEVIRTKEDIATFFAYLYIVEHTAFHPDDDFGEYVDREGKATYTKKEAATRNRLMQQAWKVSKANGLDIYEIALWVGALAGGNDPENEADAPAWLKGLSNTWI